MSKLFMIVFLASVAISCALKTGTRTHASICVLNTESSTEKWNCPFDNPVCCSLQAKACCPTGYTCDESKTPVQCRKAAGAGASALNPSIQLNSLSSVSSPAPAATNSLLGPSSTTQAPAANDGSVPPLKSQHLTVMNQSFDKILLL